jgi:hypothetical protein
MIYDVYLHLGNDGHALGHIPALIGCRWTAANLKEAWQKAPVEIDRYLEWLRSHHLPAPGTSEPVELRQVEEKRFMGSDAHQDGFFESDRQPVTLAELDRLLSMMACLRADLLHLARDVSEGTLDREASPGAWTIRQILHHLAEHEQWYLIRFFGAENLPRFHPTRTLWQRLDSIRALSVDLLWSLSEDQRKTMLIVEGELWTARKVFRCILEHEREHFYQIAEILNLININHA